MIDFGLTTGMTAGILGPMNAESNINQSWWWLPEKMEKAAG